MKKEYLSASQYFNQSIFNNSNFKQSSLENGSSKQIIENSYLFLEGNLNGYQNDKLDETSKNFIIPKTKNENPFLKADFLTSSFLTTSITSETQTSEMDLYRRASYLEEYVSCKVKELETVRFKNII